MSDSEVYNLAELTTSILVNGSMETKVLLEKLNKTENKPRRADPGLLRPLDNGMIPGISVDLLSQSESESSGLNPYMLILDRIPYSYQLASLISLPPSHLPHPPSILSALFCQLHPLISCNRGMFILFLLMPWAFSTLFLLLPTPFNCI